jgi:aminopeptidase-like protein
MIVPEQNEPSMGSSMMEWMRDLFPICRSLTGPGVRETLQYFREILPDLKICQIESGTQVFDWVVPDEWTVRDAFIENELGERIVDFKINNLHLVGYSVPIDEWMSLDELQLHLYSLPNQPDAIPYVTSYYKRHWGFCLSENQRSGLRDGRYHVVIDSDLKPGILNYAELIVKGETEEEVFLSTYVCHPSMANNELSGPVLTVALAKWLMEKRNRKYTYRFVFIPETIGSLVYLNQNLNLLKERVIAGFNINCVGDERCYSYLPSRLGNTISDRAIKHVLKHISPDFKEYTFLERGSDERQYCAPGIDLPVASLMRSKFHEFPEYHTSSDNLDLVTANGLQGSFIAHCKVIDAIECNMVPVATILGEPNLGKRGLYPTLSADKKSTNVKTILDIFTYSDGKLDLLDIAEIIGVPIWVVLNVTKNMIDKGLLKQTYTQ